MLLAILLLLCALTRAYLATAEGSPNPSSASLLWGPYRPNLYVGVRPRIPKSLLMGLMWSNADDPSEILKNLRHTCEQDEGMAGYGWAAYDVRRGGTHVVNDTGNMIDLTTQFVKIPNEKRYGNWGLRIKGIPRADAGTKKKTTVIFYLGSEDPSSRIACVKTTTSNSAVVCKDTAKGPGNFMLQILDNRDGPDILGSVAVKSLKVPENTIWQAKSIFGDQLQAGGSHMGVVGNDPGEGNLHFLQGSFDGGFEFDVLFSSDISTMTSTILTNSIQDMMSAFAESFQLIYAPQSPFKDEQHIRFSQVLLSNLMGGIGYFSGTSKAVVSSAPEFAETRPNFWEKADSAHSRNIVEEQGPFQLFSAVPSRPFFPRGFLWDEGFHLLVILDWDMDLALEIVSSWFQLMDENGWIAREQILGQESRSKVPSEFQTQYPHFANPPTLFLVVEAFVARLSGEVSYSGAPSRHLRDPAAGKAFLNGIYPKLKKNYDWFCRTQAGNLEKYHRLPGSDFIKGYRWRGRTPQHTLTSGLDDFPRAQPPHPDELHLDALCWVGSMAAALKKISSFTGEKGADQDQAMFLKHETDVIRSFDRTHWSETNQAYCDTTVVEENRVEKVCHKGYISLFPFLVGLMGPDHPHLEAMLHLIRDPEELWSPHGIRSLSLKDKYYGTDENYWRGPVWININYMVVQELLKLARQPGPHQQKAQRIYSDLRRNLVITVFESWSETGFAWEQYNPDTGQGQRTQHFTGWTSLIVRIMSMPDLDLDLPLEPRPQMPGHYVMKQSNERVSRNNQNLTFMGMALLLLSFVFRRKLIRIWRAIRKPTCAIKD